jgi:ankyrin repeat protein
LKRLKKAELIERHRNIRSRLKAGECNVVLEMIAQGLDVGEVVDGTTALIVAVKAGNRSECLALLDAGVTIDVPTSYGETALIAAVVARDMEMVKILIERGAAVNARDKFGWSALNKAALWDGPEYAEVLINSGAWVDCAASSGATPLHHAAVTGSILTCQTLLEYGARLEAETMYGATPLHMAASLGKLNACRLLIGRGASMTAQGEPPDCNGKSSRAMLTPLQSAVYMGQVDVVRYFITECGEDLAQRTLAGRTLVQVAGRDVPMRDLLRSLKTELLIAASGRGASNLSTVASPRIQTGASL